MGAKRFFSVAAFRDACRRFRIAACILPLIAVCGASGQLPDAPLPAVQQEVLRPGTAGSPQSHKPLFSLIPAPGTAIVGDNLPPQTASEKLMGPTRKTLCALAVVKPVFAAGFKEVLNKDPELGHGPDGFGRYYWRTATDEIAEEYLVQGVFPVLTHQDSRYYAMRQGGFWRRTRYALSRVVVIRNDEGREVFNSSEVLGAGVAAGLANLYYPSRERTASIAAQRFGLNVGFDALAYAAKEFWPEINRKLFHDKL